jgi:hypothetical protein
MTRRILLFFMALISIAALSLGTGCEGGSSGGGGGGNAKAVGTWSLTNAGHTWYILFAEDGTWKISNTPDGSRQRVFGTYTVSGNSVRGPMTNPGTGTGEIKATIDGDFIVLDFIEHWHTPYKVIRYSGNKL